MDDERQELARLLRDRVVHPSEAAEMISEMAPGEAAGLLASLDAEAQADVFDYLEPAVQRGLVRQMAPAAVARIIERMAPDDRADFVKSLPEETAEELLPLVARAERLDIARLTAYDEGTAGSVMTTEYAVVDLDATVAQAREQVRRQAPGEGTGNYLYVVGPNRRLVGYVTVRDLLLSRPEQPIREIVRSDYVSVNVSDDRETLADVFSRYEVTQVPVLDDANRLVGRITVDDVIDVIEEEAEEDISRLGAAGEPIDYFRSSILAAARHRLTWLLVLVFSGLITSWLLQSYQAELSAGVALAFFLPMLSGSGGNAGSQATAVVIRGLTTGEIELRHAWLVVFKELRVGLLAGVVLGVAGAARAVLMSHEDAGHALRLGLTVGLTMVCTITLAKTLGGLLPILFKRLNLDPALMSAPFIASIVDIITVAVYFGIAGVVYV